MSTFLKIVGVALVLLAGMTTLSLLSFTQGTVTGAWLHFLRQVVGWGAYALPIGFGLAGLWFFLRGLGRALSVRPEPVIGSVLLFVSIIALLHHFSPDGAATASQGGGGGYAGWYVDHALSTAIGSLDAILVLLVCAIAGAVLLFGLSLTGMMSRVSEFVGQAIDAYRERRREPEFVMPPRGEDDLIKRLSHQAEERASVPPARAPAPTVAPVPLSASAPMDSNLLVPKVIGGKDTWRLPAIEQMLDEGVDMELSQSEIRARVRTIEETLASFGVPAKVVEVNQGPTVTQFGLEPGFIERKMRSGKTRQAKVKVNRISALSNDLALALAASPIRIEAPVPGRSLVGIEVPNAQTSRVSLRGVIESEAFQKLGSRLRIALGQDVAGRPVATDLAQMPHLLIAGATGSGKSVCLNTITVCLLLDNTPADLRLIMIDPKMVELTGYNGIPHLIAPVVVDVERAVTMLKWVTGEMERRYREFSKAGARNLETFNEMLAQKGEEKLPFIVVLVDELADLMMVAPDDIERQICRIAQLARATGIHLVIATQRPSVDVVTGLIKANFPARISFAVTSQVDSRVILDAVGAEKLLGRGDMLYMSPDSSQLVRLQGVYVSDEEIDRLVTYWRGFRGSAPTPPGALLTQQPLWEDMVAKEKEAAGRDEMLERAIQVVREHNRASISLLQRTLRIGYSRAARIIDTMEEQGIIGPEEAAGRGRPVYAEPKGEASEHQSP